MVAQVRDLGLQYVDHIAFFNGMEHWDQAVELIRPQGGIVTIDATHFPMAMDMMKIKAVSLHWEMMFTRSKFETLDMIAQHELLCEVAKDIDAGHIRTTVNNVLSPINSENMRKAHALVESGQVKGKIVLEGFE